MLYVLNGSIAVVLFVLIFAFGVKLSKKSASKMKRGAIFPALVGLCTAVLSFLFLFFLEGRVLSYPNPQAAYQANHFGQIDAVTEGAYSTLVVSQDGGANSAVTILPKDGDTWKIGTGLETKIVSSIVAGSPKVLVSLYRYADSSDYYLVTNTIDLEGREIEITDSENTSFASWEQKASIGTFYYCSAYLNGLDQDYALLVNGESVTFAEEKGWFALLSWISRVIVIFALVVCGAVLFRKADFFKPRLRKLLYCFLALLVSAGVLFFPFEYWTEGFPSAEAALRFSSPSMMFSAFDVIEGENSVFALSENRKMGGADIAIVGKSGQRWNSIKREDMTPCKTAYTAQADIELYECRQTGEFYVLIAPASGERLVLSDERGTKFETYYGLYVGYLGQVKGTYNLFLNGEEISVL